MQIVRRFGQILTNNQCRCDPLMCNQRYSYLLSHGKMPYICFFVFYLLLVRRYKVLWYVVSLIIALVWTIPMHAQNWKRIDSLRYRIDHTGNDSVRITTLGELAIEIYVVHPDSSYQIMSRAIEIASKSKSPWGLAESYRVLGFIHQRSGRLQEALDNYLRAVQYFSEVRDTIALGNTYNGLGMASTHAGYDSVGYQNLLISKWFGAKTNAPYVVSLYNNLSLYHARQGSGDSALYYAQLSVQKAHDLGIDRALPFSILAEAEAYITLRNYTLAMQRIQQAQALNARFNNLLVYMRCAKLSALNYFVQKKYAPAITYSELYIRLAVQAQQMYSIREGYDFMYRLMRQTGNIEQALLYRDTLQSIRDTIAQKESASRLNRFETELKEFQQYAQSRQNKDSVERQRIIVISALMIALLMMMWVVWLVRKVRSERMARTAIKQYRDEQSQQKQNIAEKLQELEQVREESEVIHQHLAYLNAELDQAHHHKTHMTNIVSHDLKTPISSMRLSAEILQRNLDHRAFTSLYKYARKSIPQMSMLLQRMDLFIRDVLDTVYIEDREMMLQFVQVRPAHVVADSVTELEQLATNKGQTIQTDIVATSCIQADIIRLRQVVDNILSNAIKYAPFGDTIIVQLSETPTSIVFSVTDHGQGIQSDEMHKLFRPFQRLSSTPTGQEKAHGIGLNIVKKIVELHGGTIRCESLPSIETTFYVVLPLNVT